MISKTQPKTVFINKANNQSLNVTLPRFDKYTDFFVLWKESCFFQLKNARLEKAFLEKAFLVEHFSFLASVATS